MSFHEELKQRQQDGNPVRVGLIGAGKFGSMFLSQVPTTPGLEVTVICDIDIGNARSRCGDVHWDDDRIARTTFTEFVEDLAKSDEVDVIVEATGDPIAGIHHALLGIEYGKHMVMVNVEADVLVGPLLAREAARAGVVYSMAYGDQPALTLEMIDWARSCGFEVIAAGKGTKYLPEYHQSNPDTVWDYYGVTAEQAEKAGMRSKMFNSFLDGTKSGIEMAAISNASGLTPPTGGLSFPPCSSNDLAQVLRPKEDGGILESRGQVEVVSSQNRDGSDVVNDLRWGVYCVFAAPNDYSADCFRQYGMNFDDSGRYSAMYKPFHLIGLELNISILKAALEGKPTGSPTGFNADVACVAKRDMPAGEVLDGEGGYCVWGRIMPAQESVAVDTLPIGLASNAKLKREIRAGEVISRNDVQTQDDEIWRLRTRMISEFGGD